MSSKTRTAWLFLAPMLVTLLIVAAWPLGRTIWFSFTDANLNDMGAARFVGLENYFGEYGLFANTNHTEGFWLSDWGISILNTLQFSLVSVLLETMFELPTYEGVEEVVVNAEVIEGKAQPLLIYSETKKKTADGAA